MTENMKYDEIMKLSTGHIRYCIYFAQTMNVCTYQQKRRKIKKKRFAIGSIALFHRQTVVGFMIISFFFTFNI